MFTLFLTLLISLNASASVDLSPFHLTPEQVEALHKFEARGFSDKFIELMAKSYQTENANPKPKYEVYIPKHTYQDLQNLSHWAAGAAINAFVNYTDYRFDVEQYKADCPNWELFNFVRATNTTYIHYDVLALTYNIFGGLQLSLSKDTSEDNAQFKANFLNTAKNYGFEKYLKKRE